jgi:hypothetical protein
VCVCVCVCVCVYVASLSGTIRRVGGGGEGEGLSSCLDVGQVGGATNIDPPGWENHAPRWGSTYTEHTSTYMQRVQIERAPDLGLLHLVGF